MNKKQYWAAHVAKNPQLADEDHVVQLKVSSLRKLMEEAFDKGVEHREKSADWINKKIFGGL